MGLLLAATETEACGPAADASWPCTAVFRLTHNELLSRNADNLIITPLRVIVIVLVAVVLSAFARRAIERFARAPRTLLSSGPVSARAAQRAKTIGVLIRSVATTVIWSLAGLQILAEFGVNLAPLIAGAGIVGLALGFGAQTLVRDLLTGIFMLLEDQYGVGDTVDLGEASGVVEAVGLRTTRLRDVEGTVWYVPNGEIKRVANKSQEWARSLLDVEVASGTDIDKATGVIQRVAHDLWTERSEVVLEEPEVLGVERLGADGIAIRLVVKTSPAEQFGISRELRARIKVAFDAEGIELPFAQRRVLVESQPQARPAPRRRKDSSG
jgi:moderate conductance mechanosensitive channel